MPLAEIATEFHDRVKTLSSGFASVDYEDAGVHPRRSAPLECGRVTRRGSVTRLSHNHTRARVDATGVAGMEEADVVSLGLRVNQQPVDALARIVRRSKAVHLGREMVGTLAKELDRQNYEIVIQAVVDNKVVARETIRAMRKNVLAKCYGGDVSRKKKLIEKQKAGKKRAALHVGEVRIPQDAFIAVLSPGRRKAGAKR